MKKKLSISDIANHFDISNTTVSFILNGKAKEKRISKQLTNDVLKLAKEWDYKPNQLARSLRTGKTNIIALMVESIANPFFANIARSLEELAYEHKYRIIYSSTENDPVRAREQLNMFHERNVDGYIISPPHGINRDIESLYKKKFPLILFDRYIPEVDTHTVITDNYESTCDGVKHLLENGFEKIAFVTIDSLQPQMIDRMQGYEKAMQEYNRYPFTYKLPLHYTNEKVVQQLQRLIKDNDFDALFFSTNYLAISGLEAIKNLNILIPNEIGVVAFDDRDIFRLCTPTITAIAQPLQAMTEQVINILMDVLAGGDQTKVPQCVKLPSKLIIRESSVKI